MKRGTPEHPKMFLLAALLGVDHLTAIGVIESLIHWTAKYAPRGNIGIFPNEIIAQGIRWSGDPGALVRALLEAKGLSSHGWLEEHSEYRLVVHDWHDHADDSVKKLLARKGLCFWNGLCPGSGKPAEVLSGKCRDRVQTFSRNKTPALAEAEAEAEAEAGALAEANMVDSTGSNDHLHSEEFWGRVREYAVEMYQKVGSCPMKPADRSLLMKLCALVLTGKIPEHWLRDSIEAVRQTTQDKPWAYFYTCVKNRATEKKVDLPKMLKAIRPPPWTSIPASPPAVAALTSEIGAMPDA